MCCRHGTHKHMQAGEHNACRRRAMQSPPGIAVGNDNTEVGHEHLEAGERAELHGMVCWMEVGGGGRKMVQCDPDEIQAGTAEEV